MGCTSSSVPDGEVLRKQGGDAKENKKREEGKKRGGVRKIPLKNKQHKPQNKFVAFGGNSASYIYSGFFFFFLSVLPFFLCLWYKSKLHFLKVEGSNISLLKCIKK